MSNRNNIDELTRRQRVMLRDAYEHAYEHAVSQGKPVQSAYMSPCPRVGDLLVLRGLVKRGLMRVSVDSDDSVATWPRRMRITDEGYKSAAERWSCTRCGRPRERSPDVYSTCVHCTHLLLRPEFP